MNFEDFPIIRIEIEKLKQSISHHLGVVGSEYGELLQTSIDEAIKHYPFQKEVDDIVHACITEKIKTYFRYGEGNNIIKQAVNAGLNNALNLTIPPKER